MFKDNKYTKWYFNIIESAKCRINSGYIERHHIIPKCLGGSDDKENLVELTAREHFISHLLLTKMNDEPKLKYALVIMSAHNQYHKNKRYIPCSRIYEYIKKCNSVATSARLMGHEGHIKNKKYAYNTKTGESGYYDKEHINSMGADWVVGWKQESKDKISKIQKGRQYYYHPLTLQVKSFLDEDDVPNDWIKGNPNADTSEFNNIKGSKYYHDPKTGKELRFKEKEVPSGWIKGRSIKWITNGIENKQHNIVTDTLPDGWYYGRTFKDEHRRRAGRKSKYKDVIMNSPLGVYYVLDFCDKFSCRPEVVAENLDSKIRKRKDNYNLIKALEKVEYDFTKTKSENGFRILTNEKEENDG